MAVAMMKRGEIARAIIAIQSAMTVAQNEGLEHDHDDCASKLIDSLLSDPLIKAKRDAIVNEWRAERERETNERMAEQAEQSAADERYWNWSSIRLPSSKEVF